MSFNESQIQAIRHKDGPMLVLAGPGSGKTLVITQRTKYLIDEYGADPSGILVITFTRAAAREMQERFQKLMEGTASVSFGTFHAIFFSILKYAYGYTAANILKEDQKFTYLREILDHIELEIDDEADFLTGILSEISSVKNERTSLQTYHAKNCPDQVFRKIYHSYQQKLQKARLLDFDDMMVFCLELFESRPDILKAWQDKYRYILIDEFQDINQIQYDIVRLLAAPEDNLFIVGDDDQSIYRFRGAKPEIMLNFSKDYPKAQRVLLDTNYRSTPNIVEGASRIIANNKARFPKEINTVREKGKDIEFAEFVSPQEEYLKVIQQLKRYHEQGIDWNQMAILFRTNTQPGRLMERLLEYNIPFRAKDRIPNLYDHWITRDILAYIRLTRELTRQDFFQIMNRPKRYLSREAFDTPVVDFNCLRSFYEGKNWMQERIDKIEYDLKLLKNMPPYSAVNYIRHGIGYEEYIKEYADFRRLSAEDLYDTLNQLQESARPCHSYEEWFRHMEAYTRELREQVLARSHVPDGVTLSTMHASKGLEYQLVILIDANEGITPYRKAVLEADLEEERRMFYVAMTRAKSYLHIYSLKEQYGKKLTPSRFIGEYHLDLAGLVEGAPVNHVKYGDGVIRAVQNNKVKIYFPKPGKELLLDIHYCMSYQLLRLTASKGLNGRKVQ